MTEDSLRARIDDEARRQGTRAVAVALYDYARHTGCSVNGDRWFHAASTIKVPVLLGVYDAIDRGDVQPEAPVSIHNRFISLVEGRPYQLDTSRDADRAVHSALGRTMTVPELAHCMIANSSNLATNLLVDLVGVAAIRATLRRLELTGIDFRRGVEDMNAWEAGINNWLTANGLLHALCLIAEQRAISAAASQQMLALLHAPESRRGILAGLPADARAAHKTGETSEVAHDAGIVYLPGREPYALAILTEWEPDTGRRDATIAALSRVVCDYVTGEGVRS